MGESPANLVSTKHPHEPDVEPVYDSEGRCLVCGCQWRDQQIVQLEAVIVEHVRHLRAHSPECSLLPENREDDPGWEREAHGHPEWVEDEYEPGVTMPPLVERPGLIADGGDHG